MHELHSYYVSGVSVCFQITFQIAQALFRPAISGRIDQIFLAKVSLVLYSRTMSSVFSSYLVEYSKLIRRQCTLIQFLRAAQWFPASGAEKTIPGLSIRFMFLSKLICWTVLVTPGAFPTFATLALFRLLIKLLLPTLGKPTIPARKILLIVLTLKTKSST